MEVNFSDFTTKEDVHNYLLENSIKKIVKIESRLLDENSVVVQHSDSFLENCGDIKYYFEENESLEINRINSVAVFVKGNGKKIVVDYVNNNDFEPSFIDMLNNELGLNFRLRVTKFTFRVDGELSNDMYNEFRKEMMNLCKKYNLELK
ncbi:MAG: hypothetical protein JXR64_00590 [Spirochaetales bacterium]|nr:hypothetical protein [Spirochaetales bacterium]